MTMETKEEKSLLLQDICARLPYGVMVFVKDYNEPCVVEAIYDNLDVQIKGCLCYNLAFECKLYLRPMSSMTEEELHEVQEILGKGVEIREDFILSIDSSINSFTYLELQAVFDWLNAHYFDYRNLIERGLAIDCTGLNVY